MGRLQRHGGLLMPALTFVALLAPTAVLAQVPALSRGGLIVGGTAALNIEDDDGADRATAISLAPHVEVFVRNGLAVGGDVLFGHAAQGDYSATTVGVGPTVAYYFGEAGTTHPFLRGGARWLHVSSDFGQGSSSGNSTGLHASGGLLVLLSDAVGVEGALYWEHVRDDFGDASARSRNRYGLQFGVSAFVF